MFSSSPEQTKLDKCLICAELRYNTSYVQNVLLIVLGQPTVELKDATLEGDTVTVTWSFETAQPAESVMTDSESYYNVSWRNVRII